MNRRTLLQQSVLAGTVLAGTSLTAPNRSAYAATTPARSMRFGLVTYLWGKDMELPDLLKKCEASGVLGVELRTEHKHGVEPKLSKEARVEVRKRFADSPR